VSDYGAGTTSDPGLRALLSERAATIPVIWDPHPRGAAPVAETTLVTPNLAEARARTAPLRSGASTPDLMALELQALWGSRAVCVTAGSAGAYLAMPGSEPMFVPAPLISAGDPCGAGDRFVASVAQAVVRGAVVSEAVVTAVQQASIWVANGGAGGYRERRPDQAGPGGGEPDPDLAVGSSEALQRFMAEIRARGGKVVATGGCFDILHVGHIACLEAARRAGDALVVLLNSDESVRRLKGAGRPVIPAAERARVLRALQSVDAVVTFDEDDPRTALDRLRPDVWAKGGDYGGTRLPEADLVRSWGGRVLLLPYVAGRSSTAILERSPVPTPRPLRSARKPHQEKL
jgi:D-beta-D-heptose 7-phosphate kinase / D-beta-D-heptose 1-phosphate adenosyltransferase